MAAPARTISGSRFLQPKLSRFFNQVAQVCPRISRFMAAAVAALPPPLPGILASRFFGKPPTMPAQAGSGVRSVSTSRFLRPTVSRIFNQVAKARPRISRFMRATAAALPPLPGTFASSFIARPPAAPAQAATRAHTVRASRFLRPQLSRFFNQVAEARRKVISRFMGGAVTLPPAQKVLASKFLRKPPTPPQPPQPPRRSSPRKPDGPSL